MNEKRHVKEVRGDVQVSKETEAALSQGDLGEVRVGGAEYPEAHFAHEEGIVHQIEPGCRHEEQQGRRAPRGA